MSVTSCYDDSKSPYPDFSNGVSLRALPNPWTSRPIVSVSDPNRSSITFNFSSYNSDELSQVDIYVMYLPNSTIAGVTGTATVANWVAPVGTAGAIPQVPESGSTPITISYARFDQLLKGRTSTTPPVSFTPRARFLLRSLTGSSIVSSQSFTLAELVTATGVVLPSPIATTTTSQPAFMLQFEVTKKDNSVFSYSNSGPGITANPATGRVANRTFNAGNASVPYTIILSGEEGSPFIPGVSIRVVP
ncbi:MAG: hypothetical protein ACKO96_11520 [Flammeovirgaceae bacterium]